MIKLMIKHKDFWDVQQGIENIKPRRTGDNWESFSAPEVVRRLCGEGTVSDVGCGTGRMSAVFDYLDYAGYDLNPTAIEIAKESFPGKLFQVVHRYSGMLVCDTLLLHSAALHIPDDELEALFAYLPGKRIVIGETMHGHTHVKPNPKPGLATHYSRSAEDYAALLPGWDLVRTEMHLDKYSKKTFTYLVFEK